MLEDAENNTQEATHNGAAIENAEAAVSEETNVEQSANAEAAVAQPVVEEKPKRDWAQKRIDALTAEKHQERREKEALKQQTEALLAQLAEARKTGSPTADQTATNTAAQQQNKSVNLSEAEIEARALTKADEIARQRAFTTACNHTYEAGKEEFDDFDRTINTFTMFGGIPTAVLDIVTEMPKGHSVLYALGKDPDLIEKITKLPPAKQALELARLENNLSKPVAKAISGAPAPVKPIDGAGRAEEDPSRMSMDEYVAWREKTARKKR